MEAEADTGALIGRQPISRISHINKRDIRNKSLTVSFNEKDLKDYVGGFHKRKKKRRKEAERQQEVKDRHKRLEARKKRKEEKLFALYGGAPPEDNAESDAEDPELNEESDEKLPVSGTTTYENGDVMVTVTTSELADEDEEQPVKKLAPTPPLPTEGAVKKHNIPVSKKKPFKPRKGSSRPKLLSKRDRRAGKKPGKKRR